MQSHKRERDVAQSTKHGTETRHERRGAHESLPPLPPPPSPRQRHFMHTPKQQSGSNAIPSLLATCPFPTVQRSNTLESATRGSVSEGMGRPAHSQAVWAPVAPHSRPHRSGRAREAGPPSPCLRVGGLAAARCTFDLSAAPLGLRHPRIVAHLATSLHILRQSGYTFQRFHFLPPNSPMSLVDVLSDPLAQLALGVGAAVAGAGTLCLHCAAARGGSPSRAPAVPVCAAPISSLACGVHFRSVFQGLRHACGSEGAGQTCCKQEEACCCARTRPRSQGGRGRPCARARPHRTTAKSSPRQGQEGRGDRACARPRPRRPRGRMLCACVPLLARRVTCAVCVQAAPAPAAPATSGKTAKKAAKAAAAAAVAAPPPPVPEPAPAAEPAKKKKNKNKAAPAASAPAAASATPAAAPAPKKAAVPAEVRRPTFSSTPRVWRAVCAGGGRARPSGGLVRACVPFPPCRWRDRGPCLARSRRASLLFLPP